MDELLNPTPILVNKLDAGRRQLITAIRIYFANADEISTHTLTAAAAMAALRADGIEPEPIIDLGDVIPGFRIVFFRDPEGNILEFMEGYRDEER